MISTTQYFLLLIEEIEFVKIDLSIVWESSLRLGVLVSVENSWLNIIFGRDRFDVMVNDLLTLLRCFGVAPLDIVDVILNKFEWFSQILGDVELFLDSNPTFFLNIGCCKCPTPFSWMKMDFVQYFARVEGFNGATAIFSIPIYSMAA